MGIGKQIRQYREKANWTLDKLSEVSGVEPGTISALEVRDSSRSKYFPPIAKAFGLTLEQLADENTVYDLVISQTDGRVTFLEAKEPSAPYGWPFKDLKPYQWNLLTPEEQAHIESGALMFVRAREDPKHQAPASTTASA